MLCYPSSVAFPHVPTFYTAFWHCSSATSSLLSQAGLPIHLRTLKECSCACSGLSNPCRLSWAFLPFRAAFHENPPCFQSKSRSSPLERRIHILLLTFLTCHGIHSFMSATTKATLNPGTSSAGYLGSESWPWWAHFAHSLWVAEFLRLLEEDFADFHTPTRRSIAYPHHQVTFTAPGDPAELYSGCLWRGWFSPGSQACTHTTIFLLLFFDCDFFWHCFLLLINVILSKLFSCDYHCH